LSVFFLVAFNAIFAPIISEVFHKNKLGMLSDLYSNITRWITTLTLPIIIWIIVFSEEILSIFGPEYMVAKWTLIILAVGQFVNAMTGSCGNILSMTKYQKFEMINGVFIASANIGLNFLLIPKYGIIGSAIAGAMAISAVNITKLIEVLIILRLFPYNKKFLKLILPAAITLFSMMILNFYLVNITAVILGLFGSFIVFLLTLLITKLEPEDKLIIKAIIKKINS
jgi:O-antigen/teichoic acid export membrane protein